MGINKEFGYSDSRGDEVIKMVASLVEMAPEYVKSTGFVQLFFQISWVKVKFK
jgi:hypothetical protein